MNQEQLEQVVMGLHNLVMAQLGANHAQRVAFDALLSALGSGLPPILDAMGEKLDVLQAITRNDLDPESLVTFDNVIAGMKERLNIMRA